MKRLSQTLTIVGRVLLCSLTIHVPPIFPFGASLPLRFFGSAQILLRPSRCFPAIIAEAMGV